MTNYGHILGNRDMLGSARVKATRNNNTTPQNLESRALGRTRRGCTYQSTHSTTCVCGGEGVNTATPLAFNRNQSGHIAATFNLAQHDNS